MRKLKLDLEALVVESFVSTPTEQRKGTVRGHYYTELTCQFDVCGRTQAGACNSYDLGCDSGEYTCDQDCTGYGGWTCGGYHTCDGYPCAISDATNCHRCTQNQTGQTICTCPY
ncbi:MAG TPA: hypothetical protein VFE05_06580 [Longimicrobiaceae bacterium]|jgi:hypothetical protein|nr:hypothetical protein [Longimicrobiaceae bacterium]